MALTARLPFSAGHQFALSLSEELATRLARLLSDVGGIERFGQRHDFGVVARKGRLQLVDDALAQPMYAGIPDLRQERRQQSGEDRACP